MDSSKQAGAAAGAKSVKAAGSSSPTASGSPASGEQQQRSCLTSQLRKTKICAYHLKGACQYGSTCAFAHSCTELQTTPDLRKTRICQAFEQGNCTNKDCSFAHGEEELRSTNLFYKKTLCIWNQKGKCRNGAQCRFAHGAQELRTNNRDGDKGSSSATGLGGKSAKVLKEPMKILPAGYLATPTAALSPEAEPYPGMWFGSGLPETGAEMGTTPSEASQQEVLSAEAMAEMMQTLGVSATGLPFPTDAEAQDFPDFNTFQDASPAALKGAAWWPQQQWPLAYGMMAPTMVPGLPDVASIETLKSDLERLRSSMTDKDLTKDLHRLREDVMSLTQKCSEIQMRIQAGDPGAAGASVKAAPGLDFDPTCAGMAPVGCTSMAPFWS